MAKILRLESCDQCCHADRFGYWYCTHLDAPRDDGEFGRKLGCTTQDLEPIPTWCPLPNHDPRSVAVEYLSHLASIEEDDVVACEINRVVERIQQEGV